MAIPTRKHWFLAVIILVITATQIYIYIYIRTDLRKRNNNYYRTVMSPSIQIKKSNKSVDYRSRIEIFRTRKLEQSHRLMQLALALAVTSCAHDSASYK